MKSSSCFVATINLALENKIRSDLIDQGFELSKPSHTLFSAKKPGVSCTLYTSGKLTVQGKDKDAFIAFYLEPHILENLSYSYPEHHTNMSPHIGVDEAGKGDFFGPLCVAAVFAREDQVRELMRIGIRDSKQMNDANVLKRSYDIQHMCLHIILRIFPEKYNALYAQMHNLNDLLAWGHATTIAQLVAQSNCTEVIVDQFAKEELVEQALKKKGVSVHLIQKFRAEEDIVVAAASILARAAFLEGLQSLSERYSITLPKGASSQVIEKGKELVLRHGEAVLTQCAKLHFKTKHDILKG